MAAAATAPVAAVVGAVLAWLFDPDRGRARRHRLADEVVAIVRRRVRRVGARARYQRGRLRGELAHVRGAGRPAPTDDVDVKQQVHQVLHRAGVPTSDISVEVSARTAVLRGQVPFAPEIDRIAQLTASAPGVHRVENYLHLPGEPAPNKRDVLRVSSSH